VRPLALLLPLPFLVAIAAFGSARAADALGARLGAALSVIGRVVGVQAEVDSSDPFELPADLAEPTRDAPPAPGAKKAAAKKPLKKAAPAKGIFVSAQTVLKLASRGGRPRGTPVEAAGARPAGLRLSGVSALGIGLEDGDVLTRALGRPALSASSVVEGVIMARAKRLKLLDGEVYRGSERYSIQVEQPYLDAPLKAEVEPAPDSAVASR
jgi:hypothetical protein